MWREPGRRSERGVVILGIETSCDETAAARRDGRRPRALLRRVVAGRPARPLRRRRARGRLAAPPRARRARSCARRSTQPGSRSTTVERVAVTQGPGLVGALLVGVSAAKAIAWARRLPLVPVDHLEGTSPRSTSSPTRSSRRSRACSRAAATRCSSPCASAGARNGSARRSTTPRARPSTRARGCSGSAIRAARPSIGSRRKATPHAFDFPVARVAGPRLLLLRTRRPRCSMPSAISVPAETERRRADLAASYQQAIVRALVQRLPEGCDDDGSRTDRGRRRRRGELRAARRPARRRVRALRASAPTTRP